MTRWACPACGFSNLDVIINTWARLHQQHDGQFETDADDAFDRHHDWDSGSPMKCRNCARTGEAKEFETN